MARRGLAAVLMAGCAAIAIVGCSHDYEALMGTSVAGGGGGGSDPGPGTGGMVAGGGTTGAGGQPAGTAGTGDAGGYGGGGAAGTAAGRGGSGGGGAAGTTNRGGSGGGGAAGTTNRGGSGGGAAGRGGSGGGGAAGTTNRGGSGGGAAGRGGSGGGGAAGTTNRGGSGGGGAAGTNNRGGSGGGGAAGTGAGEPELVLWYKFDDATGNIAADSSNGPGAPRNGTLTAAGTGGAIAFSTEHQVGTHAVSLIANGTIGGGYVVGPSLHNVAPGAMTISAWVYVTAAQYWQRVFDFGNTPMLNLALTTHNGSNNVRFVIRTAGATDEQAINTTTNLSLSAWHHLVVVLREGAPYTGELFVDGALAGSNNAMTLHAADLGPTVNNYIGRSQFADPYFAGLIDDFRVYRRALTAEQINRLYSPRQSDQVDLAP